MSSSILLLSVRQQISKFLLWFLIIEHHLIVGVWRDICKTARNKLTAAVETRDRIDFVTIMNWILI